MYKILVPTWQETQFAPISKINAYYFAYEQMLYVVVIFRKAHNTQCANRGVFCY